MSSFILKIHGIATQDTLLFRDTAVRMSNLIETKTQNLYPGAGVYSTTDAAVRTAIAWNFYNNYTPVPQLSVSVYGDGLGITVKSQFHVLMSS
jgi:hypothetical protein